MAEAIEVQRYDKDGFAEGDGCYYMHADVAPLLAELATLRERTRRRDAATEQPAVGEWVLGQRRGRSKLRVVVELNAHRIWKDNHGWTRDITAWWPLPPTGE